MGVNRTTGVRSVCLSVRLSPLPSGCLTLCPSPLLSGLSVSPSVSPPLGLSVCPSLLPSGCPSVCLSSPRSGRAACLSVHLSLIPSGCLSLLLSGLSVCLSVCLCLSDRPRTGSPLSRRRRGRPTLTPTPLRDPTSPGPSESPGVPWSLLSLDTPKRKAPCPSPGQNRPRRDVRDQFTPKVGLTYSYLFHPSNQDITSKAILQVPFDVKIVLNSVFNFHPLLSPLAELLRAREGKPLFCYLALSSLRKSSVHQRIAQKLLSPRH